MNLKEKNQKKRMAIFVVVAVIIAAMIGVAAFLIFKKTNQQYQSKRNEIK